MCFDKGVTVIELDKVIVPAAVEHASHMNNKVDCIIVVFCSVVDLFKKFFDILRIVQGGLEICHRLILVELMSFVLFQFHQIRLG